MLLHNPDNGSTIYDMWLLDKFYFSVKLQEEFKPGDVIQIEDKAGAKLLELAQFLQEVSPIQAKNIIAKRKEKKFICDHEECGFEAKSEIGLIAHKRIHMGIVEGVKVVKPLETEEEQEEATTQDAVDQEAKANGLTGEGLRIE